MLTDPTTILFGPSGCGKTFALFDFMATTYSIFLTCRLIGSEGDPLMHKLMSSGCFQCHGDISVTVRNKNYSLFRAMTMLIIVIHAKLLCQYLSSPGAAKSPYKWLLHHCYSTESHSINREFCNEWVLELRELDSPSLDAMSQMFNELISDAFATVQGKLQGGVAFIMDEVQVMFRSYAFQAPDNDSQQHRYPFTPLIDAIESITLNVPKRVLISGTGMCFEDIRDCAWAATDPPVIFDFGGIYDTDAFTAYLHKITPALPTYLTVPLQRRILDRVAGRYSLINMVVTELLEVQRPESSPHNWMLHQEDVDNRAESAHFRGFDQIKQNIKNKASPFDEVTVSLAELTFQFMCEPRNAIKFCKHQCNLVSVGITKLSPLHISDAPVLSIRLSELNRDDLLGVRITEPYIAAAVAKDYRALIESSAAAKIVNAPAALLGSVFESLVIYGLSKCLDPNHQLYKWFFGTWFQDSTDLTDVALHGGSAVIHRLVCMPSDIISQAGQDCVSSFLEASSAPFLWLNDEYEAGPNLICKLTAKNAQREDVVIPMFIHCKLLSSSPNWSDILKQTRPETLYAAKEGSPLLMKAGILQGCAAQYPLVVRAAIVFTVDEIDAILPPLSLLDDAGML